MEKNNQIRSGAGGGFAERLFERANELQDTTGVSLSMSINLAELEIRIQGWPSLWGDDLNALIYGDFEAPQQDLHYPALGIIIKAGKRENTVVQGNALCVVQAVVGVPNKSLDSVLDAFKRLNTFCGTWTLLDWGNRGIQWWCHLVSAGGGVGGPFEKEGLSEAIDSLNRLPTQVQQKVRAALYWIRYPKRMVLESMKSDLLEVYAGYWNAFESLVEAVCLLRPQKKLTRQEKKDGIKTFLSERNKELDAESIAELYKLYVNPGFVSKAAHALRECCGARAEGYIQECFKVKPESNRLYAVRNAIDHGDVDTDDVREMFRVSDRLSRLKMIVFGMFGRLVHFKTMVDPGPDAGRKPRSVNC
jgi:hypothetical protein